MELKCTFSVQQKPKEIDLVVPILGGGSTTAAEVVSVDVLLDPLEKKQRTNCNAVTSQFYNLNNVQHLWAGK